MHICTKIINKMSYLFFLWSEVDVDFRLNELFIVCRSQIHAGNLKNETNSFSGVQSPGRGSQTLVCKTNIWEIIKKVDFLDQFLKF